MNRETLHYGFDALYVAFQGSIGRKARTALEREKQRAKAAGKPAFAVINGIDGHVSPTGARGGYAYKFEQGPMAAKWLIKDNECPTDWNIFAEVPATALAQYGFDHCVAELWADLKTFGARIASHAVNRFDIAVDIEDENFQIKPERFSVHSHSTIQRYHADDLEDGAKSVIVGGARIDTITIGKMPGRQVTIYDKRKQVVYSQKSHWWQLWGREKDEVSSVWRVELRFGKKYLKRAGIVTLDDVRERGGDLVHQSFDEVRYLDKENSAIVNATRADEDGFWSYAKAMLLEFCAGAMTGRKNVNIREVVRRDHQRMCLTQIMGFCKNIAATKLGLPEFPSVKEPDKKEAFIHNLTRDIVRQLECCSGEGWADFEAGVRRVRKKYHYIERAA